MGALNKLITRLLDPLQRLNPCFAGVSLALAAACGGGGGNPAPAPSGTTPPPAPGPGNPVLIALDRPISAWLLCGNGLEQRQGTVGTQQFVSAAGTAGIVHSHAVDPAIWTATPDSLETVMRTGTVFPADTNGDCWPDLVFTTGSGGQLALYTNRGDGTYGLSLRNVTAGTNGIAAAAMVDLDADYRPDLVLGNLLAGNLETWRANGAGGFSLLQSLPMQQSTFGLAFGDYSGDRWLDAYAAHWSSPPSAVSSTTLLRNRGTASAAGQLLPADTALAAGARNLQLAPAFVDLDQDRRDDLMIAADLGTSTVLLNTGSGGFVPAAGGLLLSDENGAGQAVRDFDNDGHWDWFVASVRAPDDDRDWPWGTLGNRFYWGTDAPPWLVDAGTGTGTDDADWPWGVCAEDFDNDGRIDIFVENGFGYAPAAVVLAQADDPFLQQVEISLHDRKFSRPRLFMNQGDRSFVDSSLSWGLVGLTNGRGVACFDHDRDGDIDIAVAQNSGPALFFDNRSSGATSNGFVSLRLLSIEPNTFAVGAVVTVEAAGTTQMRRVSINSGFQSQDGLELHFGLGTAASIDRIIVQWPGGTEQAYTDLPVNRFMTLLDPRMLAYADPIRTGRIAQALAAAEAYVAGNPDLMVDDVMAGLTVMQRLHGLELPYSPPELLLAREIVYEAEGKDTAASALRAIRRLWDPDYAVTGADFQNLEGFNTVMFPSLYCHDLALDNGNIAAVIEIDRLGSYGSTHALLALIWALDHGCDMPAAYSPALLEQIIENVYRIADDAGSASLTDVRVEAMQFLALAGRHDLIEPEWVDLLLDAQQPNGAWKADPTHIEVSSHTTGIALWLLLQLADQNKVLNGIVAKSWTRLP